MFETEFTFPAGQSGIYTVTLHAMNDWGCHSETSRNVLVNESFTLFIPSGFTPDQDGLNDGWALAGIDVDESDFDIKVFDRWGEVVYHSNDIHEVWQGDLQNGDYYVPDGTYSYIIITRSIATGDRKEVFGTVTLTR
jgi:gliding motility-associated-like protein